MSKNIKGAIPKWRFESFDSYPKWNIKKLGCLMKPINERVGDKKYILMSVTSGVGLVPQVEKFGREIAGNSYKNYYVIRKNDFAYNKSSTKEFPEGYISMLKEYEEAAIPNSIFTCFRVIDDEYEPLFFEQLFNTNYHGKWLRKYIEIGARAHGALSIDTKHLWNMLVAVPKLPEQQKIADCLSSIDDLISAEEKKLALLNDYKKGWMQKLFPAEGKTVPEWRFPEFKDRGEWTSDLIANVISTIRPPKKLSTFEYKMIGRYPIVDQGQDEFCGWTDERSSLVDFDNKVLIFGDHTCVVKLVDRPFAQGADGIKIISTKKKISVDFLFQYLCNSPIISISYKRHFSELKEKTILFPDLDSGEQEKISRFLFSIDILIKKEKNKITELKQHKKALMQGLFPTVEEVL